MKRREAVLTNTPKRVTRNNTASVTLFDLNSNINKLVENNQKIRDDILQLKDVINTIRDEFRVLLNENVNLNSKLLTHTEKIVELKKMIDDMPKNNNNNKNYGNDIIINNKNSNDVINIIIDNDNDINNNIDNVIIVENNNNVDDYNSGNIMQIRDQQQKHNQQQCLFNAHPHHQTQPQQQPHPQERQIETRYQPSQRHPPSLKHQPSQQQPLKTMSLATTSVATTSGATTSGATTEASISAAITSITSPSTMNNSPNIDTIEDVPVLRAAERFKCVFISGLHPESSIDMVKQHINKKFKFEDFRIVKISNSYHQASNYASFKKFVREHNFDKILNSEKWQIKNIIVHEFINRRPNFYKRSTSQPRLNQ